MPLLCNCGVMSLLYQLWCDAAIIKLYAMAQIVIGLVEQNDLCPGE